MKQLFKIPATTPDTVKPREDLSPETFPIGRKIKDAAEAPAERTLTANMTGQVMLAGIIDLHFNKGSLRRISRDGKTLLDKLNCKTKFSTLENNIEYRNESAFAFDGEPEYGLRTLQVPHRKKNSRRIVSDYIFNRDSEQCLINISAEYPLFEPDAVVTEAALMEFQLPVTKRGIIIRSDKKEDTIITSEDELNIIIPGRSFTITLEDHSLGLNFIDKYNSRRFVQIRNLTVKTKTVRRKKYLLINPAGSYTAAPAEYYNGVKEQLCIELILNSD